MKNNIINFINCLFNKNSNFNKKLEKFPSSKLDTYMNKEVIVVTPDDQEYKIKQYCKHNDNKEFVLISESIYDKEKKIYHTYYDCYEDWPQSDDFKFSKWKLIDKNNLNDYTKCSRCSEREYRKKHPNQEMTGFDFDYYYENLRRPKMNTLDMYKIAENEKIDILDYKWTNTKARIFEIDNNYYIALDNKQINNSIEEKEILAEELGHYYCNALYYLDSDNVQKKKCEYRAMKWAYSVLVPLQKLKEKLTQGFNLYELADYFNVDCKYMIECINFYVEKYGVLV